jgi:transposase
VIALSSRTHIIEPIVYTGTADAPLVLAYFQSVLPLLKKGSIVMMDNASTHKSVALQHIFDQQGITLLFLPPYSPELNPIEKIWGHIKQELRHSFDYSENLFENLCRVLNTHTAEL